MPVLVPSGFQVWDGGHNSSDSFFLVPRFWSGAKSKSPSAWPLLFSDLHGLERSTVPSDFFLFAAASLAALSASSFPSISLWLGIHLSITSPPWVWSCLACLRIWILNAWPALLLKPWSCLRAVWESEKTVTLRTFLLALSFKAIFKASDMPHSSASNISLFSPKEILRVFHPSVGKPFHTTAAPAPPDSALDGIDLFRYNAIIYNF